MTACRDHLDNPSWADAAAHAAANPPPCFAAWQLDVLPPTQSNDPVVRFGLRCRGCGSDRFKLFGYPFAPTDLLEQADAGPDGTLYLAPYRAACGKCRTSYMLFDPRRHGYDGALGHPCTYRTGSGHEAPVDKTGSCSQLELCLAFNSDLEELLEIEKDNRVAPADLFDGFTIEARRATDEPAFVTFAFECA